MRAKNNDNVGTLNHVYAPQVVGIPPTNAIHDLMRLPDGELRHYGFTGDFRVGIRMVYLRSRDHGLSWSEHDAPAGSPGATVQSPWSGDWLTVLTSHGQQSLEEFQDAHRLLPGPGIWLFRSRTGPDGPYAASKVMDLPPRTLLPRQPLALRQRQRWVLPGHGAGADGGLRPLVLLSDDDGASWRLVWLTAVPRPGVAWPHAGPRWWNCGDEPTVAELGDGRLYMLIRTAHDQFWESWSHDGGESWDTPAPSRFWGTITTPLLHRLSDGRLLAVWNSTTPLPEVDHATQDGLSDDERAGVWEDVFTNRDALHAAISADDGANWRGFRELLLNERRNDGDFRSSGGNDVTVDKSIHQSQAVELPGGKVLLAVGQHPRCRRLVVFDPAWLLEEERSEDFRHGLGGWSVQQYLRSVAGNYRGHSGHCALNRRAGAALVPDPDGRMREVLRIARHPDPRLLDEREGAVWNFPAGRRGRLHLRLQLPVGSAGARIALLDHWLNPTDPVVGHYAQVLLELDGAGRCDGIARLIPGRWHDLVLGWDLDGAGITAQVDAGESWPLPCRTPCRDGLSYLHLQSSAESADFHGLLLESVAKSAGP